MNPLAVSFTGFAVFMIAALSAFDSESVDITAKKAMHTVI